MAPEMVSGKVSFEDVKRSPERSAIMALKTFGIVQGRGNSLDAYAPHARVSRAEFVKMLVRTHDLL